MVKLLASGGLWGEVGEKVIFHKNLQNVSLLS
jgi:hypothetical protein